MGSDEHLQAQQELEERLRTLPPSTEHAFFDELGKFLGQRDDCYIPLLTHAVDSGELDGDALLGACWGLLHGARRLKNRKSFRANVEVLRHHFPNHPLTDLMRAEQLSSDASSERELREALELARRGNVGLANASTYMTTIAILLALCAYDPSDKADRLDEIDRLIKEAIEDCRGGYPKLFAMQAQVESERGMHISALRSIDRAIEEEDNERKDYPLRIGDYQAVRLSIIFESELTRLRAEQATVMSEIRESKTELLSLLGLLSAVIALLVTTVQVAAKLDVRDATRYSVVTAGSILLVFTGYQFLFSYRGPRRRYLTVLAMGALLVAIPLYYWPEVT